MASLWEELKRRNVVRVGIAYAVVCWLILQLTDVLMPVLNLPEWVDGLIFLLLTVGFILTLFFSWVYEITPEGVKLEKDVDRSSSITQVTGRKLDFVIIAILSVAVAFFTIDKFVWTETPDLPDNQVAETVAEISEPQVELTADLDTGPTSIAVLPFVNMSNDAEQEYFSDGLSEELLNLLAKIPELRVTSRTSAFSFKGKDFTISELGELLDVDHVLEGSVRRSGDTIRVTAQLIEVATDAHTWSETWDRTFDDVFVIQDEIAAHVVGALKLRLIGGVPEVQETSPEAYTKYLRANFLLGQGNAESVRQAETTIKEAIEIDPEYAPAWHSLALAYLFGSTRGIRDPIEAMPLIREAADKALAIDPRFVASHIMRAQVAFQFDYEFDVAREQLEIALELEPWNSHVHSLAARIAYAEGNFRESVEHREAAHQLDPLAGHRMGFAIGSYYYAGHRDEALQYFAASAANNPFVPQRYSEWARVVLLEGDHEGALQLFENEVSDGHRTTGRALVFQAMGDIERANVEREKLLELGGRWTFELAEVHAYLGYPDEAFEWLDRAIDRRDGSLQTIVYNPWLDNIRDDPRFDQILERVGRKSEF